MIRLTQDEAQPKARQPAETQPFPIAMRLDDFIQYRGNTHPLLLMHQQGHIVDSLSVNLYFCHSDRSLTQSRFLGKK